MKLWLFTAPATTYESVTDEDANTHPSSTTASAFAGGLGFSFAGLTAIRKAFSYCCFFFFFLKPFMILSLALKGINMLQKSSHGSRLLIRGLRGDKRVYFCFKALSSHLRLTIALPKERTVCVQGTACSRAESVDVETLNTSM